METGESTRGKTSSMVPNSQLMGAREGTWGKTSSMVPNSQLIPNSQLMKTALAKRHVEACDLDDGEYSDDEDWDSSDDEDDDMP